MTCEEILKSLSSPTVTINTRIHIISKGKKWAMCRARSKRATKLFDHREVAFLYAVERLKHFEVLAVHNKDGSVEFIWYRGKVVKYRG